ncbi:MAG TPA: nucleotide disphospho-sugar-binding domain-containing protein [Pseudonocardiaceae bacterium]|nr:nucleotide disphospho-sugar-binding domain-containing protein [Pseudonocardiaceae bacterium]
MRALIVTSPGIGHLFPTVSTAWALRAAGHDVLVATGGHHELAAHAGLPTVDVAPGVDFGAVFRNFFAEHGTPGGSDVVRSAGLDFVGELFATVSRHFVDHTVELARTWRPDVVLYTPLQGAGQLAAQVVGVPSIAHTIGIAQPSILWTSVARHLAAEYERFGVAPKDPVRTLDVTPTSLRMPGPGDRLPMRYVPYNGGAVLPPWVLAPRDRPLVTVTLGSVVPQLAGGAALRPFVAAAGAVTADFVILSGGADPADFGALPDNVRVADWVPLGAVLARSAAVIHHGGAGTTLTALDAGLPALVLPQGADQFANAEVVAKAGAGAVVTPNDLDADRITELLAATQLRTAAQEIAAEMAAMPAPAQLVPEIVGVAC